MDSFNVVHPENFSNNTWALCTMENQLGVKETFEVLLLVIPFEQNGAMETFLLNAIANDSPYDNAIIQSCNQLVDSVDPQNLYLKSRRYITKAKFDTYFSIRTPAEQFAERQKILKNVNGNNTPGYKRILLDYRRFKMRFGI